MTPRLTLNLGVREDIMVNFASFYSPHLTNFILGSGSTDECPDRRRLGHPGILAEGPRSQHRRIYAACRFLLGCLRQGQNGGARRFRPVRGPAAVPAHHRHHLRQFAQLLYTVQQHPFRDDAGFPALQQIGGLGRGVPDRQYQQCHDRVERPTPDQWRGAESRHGRIRPQPEDDASRRVVVERAAAASEQPDRRVELLRHRVSSSGVV